MSIPAPRAPRIPKPPGTHFMVDPVRIRSTWLKVGYIAAYALLALFLGRVNAALGTPDLLAVFLANALLVATIIVGARVFRVREEDPVPARPWWQLTGRPKAGFVIVGLIVVGDIFAWVGQITGWSPGDTPSLILNSVFNIAIVAMYVRSSVLLRRRASA